MRLEPASAAGMKRHRADVDDRRPPRGLPCLGQTPGRPVWCPWNFTSSTRCMACSGKSKKASDGLVVASGWWIPATVSSRSGKPRRASIASAVVARACRSETLASKNATRPGPSRMRCQSGSARGRRSTTTTSAPQAAERADHLAAQCTRTACNHCRASREVERIGGALQHGYPSSSEMTSKVRR